MDTPDIQCPRCKTTVGTWQGGKLKISVRSRLLAVVAKSGQAETNCPDCKAVVYLPLFLKEGAQ